MTEEKDETASAEFRYRFCARHFTENHKKQSNCEGTLAAASLLRRVTPRFLCRGVNSSRLGALNESTLISLICESSRRLKARSHIWTSATVRRRRHGENHKNREKTKGLWRDCRRVALFSESELHVYMFINPHLQPAAVLCSYFNSSSSSIITFPSNVTTNGPETPKQPTESTPFTPETIKSRHLRRFFI